MCSLSSVVIIIAAVAGVTTATMIVVLLLSLLFEKTKQDMLCFSTLMCLYCCCSYCCYRCYCNRRCRAFCYLQSTCHNAISWRWDQVPTLTSYFLCLPARNIVQRPSFPFPFKSCFCLWSHPTRFCL